MKSERWQVVDTVWRDVWRDEEEGQKRQGLPGSEAESQKNYCWDEKIEKGEKTPRLCHVSWHAMS